MTVAELIEKLAKLDPALPVVSIHGDCDDIYLASDPDFLWIDNPKDPTSWSRTEVWSSAYDARFVQAVLIG